MITSKVGRWGNSAGIVLPKEALTMLRAKLGDQVYLCEAPGGVLLTVYNEEIREELEAAEKVMHRDRNILRELAK